jgi:hypothetical protein
MTTVCIDATVTSNERKGYTRPCAITDKKNFSPFRGMDQYPEFHFNREWVWAYLTSSFPGITTFDATNTLNPS